MFNKKSFLNVLGYYVLVVFLLVITGCEFAESDVHRHLYSEEWSFSEKTHWHKSLCCEGLKSEEKTHNLVSKTEKDLSCTESGLVVYSCSICGFSKEENKTAAGHAYSEWENIPANCISAGSRRKVCTVCGDVVEEETGEPTGIHMFGDWNITLEPDCLEKGEQVRICAICGFEESEIIPAKGHDYSEWETVHATCVSSGSRSKECKACGEKVTEKTYDATGIHMFGDWNITLEPDCLEKGEQVRTCSICGFEESEIIPAKGHNYSEWETVHATCVSAGSRSKKCKVCGEKITEKTYDATGIHMFGDWNITLEPDCLTEGEQTRTCSVCAFEESEIIPAKEHDYSEWETVHATCVSAGSRCKECKACGERITEKTYDATGIHMFGDWNITLEPDCLIEGDQVRTCAVCGFEESEIIPAKGHDYSEWETVHATCVSAGSRSKNCKVCGEKVTEKTYDATGIHMFGDWNITLESDCLTEGEQIRTCAVCGFEESEIIPAKGHDYSEWETVHATCVSAGSRSKSCKTCGEKVIEETSEPTGIHTYGEWEVTKDATCSEEGNRNRFCSVCDKLESETINFLEHNWDEGVVEKEATVLEKGEILFTCESCGRKRAEEIPMVQREKLEEIGKLKVLENYKSEGEADGFKYYSFGVWPQTIKAAEVEVFQSIENTEGFSEPYYLGSDGGWYACLEENPVNYGGTSGVNTRYAYSNGDYARLKENGRFLYFKVEPLIWIMQGDSGILLSEKVLAGGIRFYDVQKSERKSGEETLYAGIYEASSVRAYLNGSSYLGEENIENTNYQNKGFLNGAFNKVLQEMILVSEIKNDSASTVDFSGTMPAADGTVSYENKNGTVDFYPDYTGDSVFDKIFLMSLNELTNPDWGFAASAEAEDALRRRKATDYAIADSVFLGDKGVNWYTRTPYYKVKDKLSNKNIVVNASGKVSSTVYSNSNETGIVPALRIR